jgi:hypothetical protein
VIKPLFSPSYIGASVVSSYVNPRTGAGKYVKSTYYPGKTSYKPSYPTYTPSKYPTFTTPTYQPIKYPDSSKVVYPNYTPPKYPYYPISTYPTYTPPTPINYTPPTYPTYPTITYPIYYPSKTPTLKKTEQRKERANTKYEKRVAKAFTQSKTKLFKMPDVSNILLPIKTDWLKSFGSVKQQRYPKVKTIKLTPNERKENKKIARLLGFKFDRLF